MRQGRSERYYIKVINANYSLSQSQAQIHANTRAYTDTDIYKRKCTRIYTRTHENARTHRR